MKKFAKRNKTILIIVAASLLLSIGIVSYFTYCVNWYFTGQKYMIGRDTKKAFGDGKVQILRYSDGTYSLISLEKEAPYEAHVFAYYEEDSNIFAIGKWGYSVVNYETDEYIQKKKLTDLPVEYQHYFENQDQFTFLK